MSRTFFESRAISRLKKKISQGPCYSENQRLRHLCGPWRTIRYVQSLTKSETPQRLAPGRSDFPRQTTILASKTDPLAQEKIITTLKHKFCLPKAYWDKQLKLSAKQHHGLLIIATPRFAQWLEDDTGFIAKVLDTLTSVPKALGAHLKHPLEIDIVCACVDGLSPSAEPAPSQSLAPEGFSFLQHNDVGKLFPSLWLEEEPATSNRETRSSLTFSGQLPWKANVTLPLANTLFLTGKMSLLRVSKWLRPIDEPFTRVLSMTRTHQTVNIFNSSQSSELFSFVPATPLTPARPIVNGLGNIIRRIDFGPDGVGPASRELETRVEDHRARLSKFSESANSVAFAVWALVVPEAAVQRSTSGSLHSISLSSTEAQIESSDTFHGYIDHWLKEGAVLCRVLSGGGGWGAKQGLLSLDPQTTFNEVEEPQLNFTNGSIEEQQLSGLGDIAKPGAYIQFFVASPEMSSGRLKQPPDFFDPKKRGVVIGTSPSTIDDIISTTTDTLDEDLSVRNGHFGCVSQSGIYVSKKIPDSISESPEKPSFSTKIDIPYSYVYT